MKKTSRQINLFDISKVEHKSVRSDKIKTTDINILLNRVRITKKNEFSASKVPNSDFEITDGSI